LYAICIGSLEPRITESVRQLGDLLLSIKGGGQVTLNQPSQRNAVAAEADEVLRPLMDLLDGQLLYCYLLLIQVAFFTLLLHYCNYVYFKNCKQRMVTLASNVTMPQISSFCLTIC
jgi:hypothetical protein